MDYLPVFTFLVCVQLPLLWSSGTDATQLNDYILDFQPLQFNPQHLHEKHSRVKRAIDPYLRWNFRAYGRTFNVQLSPVQSIFTPDHLLDMGKGDPVAVDTSFIYEGSLTDDPQSVVHMSILNDSLLGYIHIPGQNTYHIEPARKHLKEPKYPSIIYPESRMNLDPYRHKRFATTREDASCGSKAIFEKLRQMSQPVDTPNIKRKKREAYSENVSHNKYSAYYNSEVHSRKRRDLEVDRKSCFLHLRADKILYDNILQNEDGDAQKAKDDILAMFAIHVSAIKRIYSSTNFVEADNSQVSYRGVTFQLQKSTIMTDCNSRPTGYCTNSLDVSNFLDLTSLENHDDFCLVHTFTHRDFIGGTLGLAWVATPDSPNAGVCARNVRISDGSRTKRKSLNTGITTLINFKREVPSRVSQLTFAHEVGHNFGSKHDESDQCAPYGTSQPDGRDGNYIMFPSANQGNLPNNNRFSKCSKDYIAKVLASIENGQRTNCLKASNATFCGNSVVEGNEECDCGYDDECTDVCCYSRPLEGTNDKMCKRNESAQCSPSEGVCCNKNCRYVGSGVCQAEGDCTQESSCLSINASCPEPGHKPDKETFCNEYNGVCISGECIGSICENIGWEECFKKVSGDSESEELCFVACQKPNTTGCISSNDKSALDEATNLDFKHLLENIVKNKSLSQTGLGVKKPAGSRCNFNKGYCDILSKCRNIDAEGPFKQLTDLIFNPVTLERIQDWIVDYWWAVLLMCFGAIVLMVLFVKVFGYNTPSEDPKKKRRNANGQNDQNDQNAQNAQNAQGGAAGGRARQPDKRSRPAERASVYATDVPMYDYGSNSGHTNYGYDDQEVQRRSQGPPAYPNYVGPQGNHGKPSRGQQFDRISGPPKY